MWRLPRLIFLHWKWRLPRLIFLHRKWRLPRLIFLHRKWRHPKALQPVSSVPPRKIHIISKTIFNTLESVVFFHHTNSNLHCKGKLANTVATKISLLVAFRHHIYLKLLTTKKKKNINLYYKKWERQILLNWMERTKNEKISLLQGFPLHNIKVSIYYLLVCRLSCQSTFKQDVLMS